MPRKTGKLVKRSKTTIEETFENLDVSQLGSLPAMDADDGDIEDDDEEEDEE